MNFEGAVLSSTVSHLAFTLDCLVVASVAEPDMATTAEEGNRAAILALPVDELSIVAFLADVRANTHIFQEAGATDEVLAASRVFSPHLLLAVYQATEVWLRALGAHVKADLSLRILQGFVVEEVTFCHHPLVPIHTLTLCHLHGLHLQGRSEVDELVDLIEDLINVVRLDRRLTSRTAHEGKGDPQAGPLVLEKFDDAVGVEDVPAAQLHARFLTKFARVANRAQLFIHREIGTFDTVRLETG